MGRMAMSDASTVKEQDQSLARIAAALAAAAVAVMFVLAAMDHDGAGWLLQPAFGLAAVIAAWKAGGTSPRNRLAFIALVFGALMIVVFAVYAIADA